MTKQLYVDAELLNEKIADSGYKIGYIVEQLGLSRNGFNKKMKGLTPFKLTEVFVLCSILSIPNDEKMKIFYPKEQPRS